MRGRVRELRIGGRDSAAGIKRRLRGGTRHGWSKSFRNFIPELERGARRVKRNAQTVHNDAQLLASGLDFQAGRRVENNFLKEVNKHHLTRGISDAKRAAASLILRAKPTDPILGIGTNSLNYQN